MSFTYSARCSLLLFPLPPQQCISRIVALCILLCRYALFSNARTNFTYCSCQRAESIALHSRQLPSTIFHHHMPWLLCFHASTPLPVVTEPPFPRTVCCAVTSKHTSGLDQPASTLPDRCLRATPLPLCQQQSQLHCGTLSPVLCLCRFRKILPHQCPMPGCTSLDSLLWRQIPDLAFFPRCVSSSVTLINPQRRNAELLPQQHNSTFYPS